MSRPTIPPPALAPPSPELPPPFWLDPRFWLGALVVAAVAYGIIRVCVRIVRELRRPPDPVKVARAALAGAPDTRAVTRALRTLLAAKFPDLPAGLTTEELARDPRLAALPDWIAFLRECDGVKFAGIASREDQARRALALTDAVEISLREKPGAAR